MPVIYSSSRDAALVSRIIDSRQLQQRREFTMLLPGVGLCAYAFTVIPADLTGSMPTEMLKQRTERFDIKFKRLSASWL